MPGVLFLVHRIPYPPNKGDKIRSFHLLEFLSRSFDVHLGAFVDDPDDWRHADALDRYCASRFLREFPGKRIGQALRALLHGGALTPEFYADREMERWVSETLAGKEIDTIVVYSSAMGRFIPPDCSLPVVTDFVDVDSDKWAQYARSAQQPLKWLYRREARTLAGWERGLADRSVASVFVTEHEAELFRQIAPAAHGRIHAVENGVDTQFFDPALSFDCPYPDNVPIFVFTGAMDYQANVDAVVWFATEVHPRIRERHPDAGFCIVGVNPAKAVRRLGGHNGITVTGRVDDVRPYLQHARAAVAPLRIARGIQNKVLEAMAMARPVLATRAAIDGIPLPEQLDALISEQPETLAVLAGEVISGVHSTTGASGREFVLRHYRWDRNLEKFGGLLPAAQHQTTVPTSGAPAW